MGGQPRPQERGGGQTFSTWSSANVGSYFMIVLDDKVQETPYIKNAITTGTAAISGSFDLRDRQHLATILQYGALPFPMQCADRRRTSPPRLARRSSIRRCLPAPSGSCSSCCSCSSTTGCRAVIACMALTYYSVAVLAIFRIVPVTLTLGRHSGLRALGRYGGGRQHPDIREDQGRATDRQDPRSRRSRRASTGPGTRSSTPTFRA